MRVRQLDVGCCGSGRPSRGSTGSGITQAGWGVKGKGVERRLAAEVCAKQGKWAGSLNTFEH